MLRFSLCAGYDWPGRNQGGNGKNNTKGQLHVFETHPPSRHPWTVPGELSVRQRSGRGVPGFSRDGHRRPAPRPGRTRLRKPQSGRSRWSRLLSHRFPNQALKTLVPSLAGLPRLQSLNLGSTRITDAGLPGNRSSKATPIAELELHQITDAGLKAWPSSGNCNRGLSRFARITDGA